MVVEYTRKSIPCHFIGKIVGFWDTYDTPYEVEFLKKSTKSDSFIKSSEEDKDNVGDDMIKKKLRKPKTTGTEKRLFYNFPDDDLSAFNWQ